MENRQKFICGLGALAFVGSSFLAGVWFGKRYSTFVLTNTTPPTASTTSDISNTKSDDAKSSNE